MSDRSVKATATGGTLYVVATPIGNLRDLTPRAADILGSVSLIAAEDTRHTGQLLQLFGIDTRLTPLHEHNEGGKVDSLIAALLGGESVAIVSDAGTPLISDPGFSLIAAARSNGVAVVAVPGACAAIAALSVAGLPTDRFAFEGFLPAKTTARRAQLESLVAESRTLIFYEAPHRIVEALQDMATMLGNERAASVSRELTKRFETTYYGTLAELAQKAASDADMSRGEIVIVVQGASVQVAMLALDAQKILRLLAEELSPAQAAKLTAKITGAKRSELYELATSLARPSR
ncbi:MAG: 16S rRNA (cytidine(1402)-2'-O)-methyltransferase [Steroidobacteraceae bacterium]